MSSEHKDSEAQESKTFEPVWSEERKHESVVLSADASERLCVARHSGSLGSHQSVLSHHPVVSNSSSSAASKAKKASQPVPSSASSASVSLSSSSPSSSVVACEIRVDRFTYEMFIGLSADLPTVGASVGGAGLGISYHSNGDVYLNGQNAKRANGTNIECAMYGTGDVIRVELDVAAQTVTFFKNGVLQDQPVDVSKQKAQKAQKPKSALDLSKPLYVAVTMTGPDTQVTLREATEGTTQDSDD